MAGSKRIPADASITDLVDMRGRRALVTGGAGHLGRVSADTLLQLGAEVALLDIDSSGLDGARCSLERSGPEQGRVITLPCDLADADMVRASVRKVVESLGGLDVVVHCASLVGTDDLEGWSVPFERQSVAAFEAAVRIGVTSAFVIAQEGREALADSGGGSMILFGSIYGHVGPVPSLYAGTEMGNPAGYGVAKGGLGQLTRHLAIVLAPRVRVNAISPGGVLRGQPDAFQRRYIDRVPLGRMADDQDIRGAVAFLASDLSAYVTGHDLMVDGGWTAW